MLDTKRVHTVHIKYICLTSNSDEHIAGNVHSTRRQWKG